jgi:hypothetical protein
MDVNIQEMTSTVHAVDAHAPISPKNVQHILGIVMKAVKEEMEHAKRVEAEKKISTGVRDEQEGES